MGPTFASKPRFLAAVGHLALRQEATRTQRRGVRVRKGRLRPHLLPPRENIILTNMSGEGGRGFAMPAMDGHSMLINIGDRAFTHPTGPMRYPSDPLEDKAYPRPGQLLIHELVHAWQFSRMNRFVPGYICRGASSVSKSATTYSTVPTYRPRLEVSGARISGWSRRPRQSTSGSGSTPSSPQQAHLGPPWTNCVKG